jgi:acetyl-CoA acetyltransferase
MGGDCLFSQGVQENQRVICCGQIFKQMKTVNFEFLRPENEVLANLAGLAEAVLFVDPGSALTRLRSFAEELTKAIYKEEMLPRLPQSTFYDLVKNPVFIDCVSKPLVHQINFLRIQGNDAAHGGEGELRNAKMALEAAHQLAMYMAIKYYRKPRDLIPGFSQITDPTATLARLQKSVSSCESELQKQQEELQHVIAQLEYERTRNIEKLEPPAKPDQQKRKQQSEQVSDSLQWSEAKTRALLIDAMLLQAGWDVDNPAQVGKEFEVPFPDNPSGKGYADYVLWGENGEPLAVIEAKKSGNNSLQAGREQARMYADGFERMGYQRPVIFYSNGYETFIWDDCQYNTYRPIYGFYSRLSLEYLIYQRQYRVAELERFNPELSIADRPYQIEAIKTVAAHFQSQRRKALIIQATGTGKTRVAIALAELLLRTGWAKRVLFLCDRKELRSQADDAFKQNLPSEPRCVIGEANLIDQTSEKLSHQDRGRSLAVFDAGWDVALTDQSRAALLALGGMDDARLPPPAERRSLFMDIYAAFARQHMRLYGSTAEQFAAVAAKNHVHSVHNERAQFRRPYTIEEVLADRPIAWPLTLPMCAPVSDGAAAAILCTDKGLERLGAASRAIRLRACVPGTSIDRAPDDLDRHIGRITALKAYGAASLGPEDVDVAEVHDATAVGEVIQVENLGLVPRGLGGEAALQGQTCLGGRIPVNPSGGLESKGHPIGATGLAQIFELVTQLRGEAGQRQVDNATVAIAENGGGLWGVEEAVCAISILSR